MDISRAKEIVRSLADGIDPTTGEVFPIDSVYNAPDVIRALFTLLEKVNCDESSDPLRNAGKPWTNEEDVRLQKAYIAKKKSRILLMNTDAQMVPSLVDWSIWV